MKQFNWSGKLKISFQEKDLKIMEKKHPELYFKKRHPTKIKVTHKKNMSLLFL